MRKSFIISILVLSGLLGLVVSIWVHQSFFLATASDVKEIQTFHFPSLLVQQLKNDPRAGEKIFKTFCTSCHGVEPIIEVNAPKQCNSVVWEAKKKMGMKTLLFLTTQGIGAMPARGGCFECSDEQLAEAIGYMMKKCS